MGGSRHVVLLQKNKDVSVLLHVSSAFIGVNVFSRKLDLLLKVNDSRTKSVVK